MLPRTLVALLTDLRTPLYRNTLFIILNLGTIAVLGFLFWVLVTRYFPNPATFTNSLILTQTAMFLGFLSTLGFGQGMIRFLPNFEGNPLAMANSVLTLSSLASLGFSTLFLVVVVPRWYPEGAFLLASPLSAAAFFLFVILFVNFGLIDYVFTARRRVDYAVGKNLLSQVAKFALLFALLSLGEGSILLSYGAGMAFALSLAVIYLAPRTLPGFRPTLTIDWPLVREMIRYSFLNHVAEIMALAPGIVLLYMVNLQFPPQVAGAFGAAWVIVGTSVLLVPVAAATSLFVEGSHSREALGTDLRRTVRLTLPLLGAATLGLFFLGRPVLGLFGEGYAEGGAGVLQLLALSGAFFTVNTLYTAVKRVEKRMDAVVAVVTYTAAVTVGLTAYLLPAHGIVAAGYAFMVAHGTMSLAIGLAYVGRRLAGSRTARVGSGALGNGRR